MTLGLGIFLSSLFLGTIFLFVKTKDRWNWKKILFVWPLCIVLVVGVIGGGGLYIYNQYENKPITYDTYLDISLNASENDLIFAKGIEYISKRYDSNKKHVKYSYLISEDDDHRNAFRLKDNKVWRISCSSIRLFDCPAINKIRTRDTTNEVKKRLGEPDHVFNSTDNTSRLWVYEKFNLYMTLEKGIVDAIGIFEPNLGIPKYFDTNYSFIDMYKFGSSKITLKGVPLKYDDNNEVNYVDRYTLNELLGTTYSHGTEIIWSEYVALKEKTDEAIAAAKERDRIEGLKAAEEHKKAQQQAKLKAEERRKELAAKAKKLSKAKELANAGKQKQADIDAFRKAGDNTFNNDNWQKIKKGMAKYQVVKLLGEPVRKEGKYWYYSEDRREGAHLLFRYNSTSGVQEVRYFVEP